MRPLPDRMIEALWGQAKQVRWPRGLVDRTDVDLAIGGATPNWDEIRFCSSDRYVDVFTEVRALRYRLDILMACPLLPFRCLAIECDGRDFHERTKQQASADRWRDAELFAFGIPTIRFMGSDLFHEPERCADQALACFLSSVPNPATTKSPHKPPRDVSVRDSVVDALRKHGPQRSRSMIAKLVGARRPDVFYEVDAMLRDGDLFFVEGELRLGFDPADDEAAR